METYSSSLENAHEVVNHVEDYCDVARYSANTAIMVAKVLPGKENFKKNIIYTEVIHGANYITDQAPRIKKLIQLYQPREVVIDGNGRIKPWPTW